MKREPLNKYNFVEKNYENNTAYIIHINRNGVESKCLVDLDKIDYLKDKTWRLWDRDFFTWNNINQPIISIYKYLLYEKLEDNCVVDHRNCNPLDCRISNLRITTQGNNCLNKHINNMTKNTSGFIGVSWQEDRKKWTPEIKFRYKRCHLCRYDKLEDAAYARLIAEIILFKNYRNRINDNNIYKEIKKISRNRKLEIRKYVVNKLSVKYAGVI